MSHRRHWDFPNQPLSRQRVCPSPGTKRGGVRGVESPNSDDWRKGLALCLLCGCAQLPFFLSVVNPGQSSWLYIPDLEKIEARSFFGTRGRRQNRVLEVKVNLCQFLSFQDKFPHNFQLWFPPLPFQNTPRDPVLKNPSLFWVTVN
jgi:hypothetical protein